MAIVRCFMRCPPENRRIVIYPVDGIRAIAESRHWAGMPKQGWTPV
jgi:hypothetical protein